MKNRRYNKLRSNPFIRLFRTIYRLLKVIFRLRKKNSKLINNDRIDLDILAEAKALNERIELENRLKEQFLTVGDLLGRVKWQTPQETVLKINSVPPEYDVSRN